MGIMDKANELKDKAMGKAKDAMGKDENVDKAAKMAKDKTGNKHDDQVDKAAEKAKDMNDSM
jgi:MT0933-like antitoxin protein